MVMRKTPVLVVVGLRGFMDKEKAFSKIGESVRLEGCLLFGCFSSGTIIVILWPFFGIEEVLVKVEISLVVEEKIGRMIMSFDDRLGVVVERDIHALHLLSGSFIFVGNPEVFVIEHEDVRSMEWFRDDDVMIGDQFFVVIQTTKGGLLNGKVMEEVVISCQAVGLCDGGRDVAAGRVMEKVCTRRSEHDEAFTVGVIIKKVLDVIGLKERAEYALGTMGGRINSLGKKVE